MKLGIEGKWALVCAASKGLGKGCAKALVMEGVNVVITARGSETLEATASELRALNPDVKVITVAGDITTLPDARGFIYRTGSRSKGAHQHAHRASPAQQSSYDRFGARPTKTRDETLN